ncbi:MAG: LamG-like jellyroll fold domain-containing protein, partial [Bacteroidota bacterium]
SGFGLFTADDSTIFARAGDFTTGTSAIAYTKYKTNQWIHVACTWNPFDDYIYIYVNGSSESSNTQIFSFTCTEPVFIGRMSSSVYAYKGVIDDIHIYNCPLDMMQIDSIYQAEKPPVICEAGDYPLNGDGDDVSWLNNDGTCYNTPAITDRYDNATGAAYFNGTGSYIQVDTDVIPVNDEFTLSIWVKHSSSQSGNFSIVSQGASAGTSFNFSRNSGYIHVCDEWGDTGIPFPDDDKWHFYTVVKTYMDIELYIDGQWETSYGMSPAISAGGNMRIGRKYLSFTDYYQGSLDDLKISACPLSMWQIDSMYQADRPYSLCLRADYPFNDNSQDESGNNLHLTQQGSVMATTDRDGTPLSAYSFNGANAYMYSDSAVIPTNGDFTLIVWAQHNNAQTDTFTIISQGTDPVVKAGGSSFSLGTNIFDAISIGPDWHYTSVTYPDDNEWHMFAVVQEMSGTKLYVDGLLAESLGYNIMNPYGKPFTVGAEPDGFTGLFDGKIDDIKVFNCALDSFEIFMEYGEGILITQQPESDTACAGEDVMLVVNAYGTGLSYQWRQNGFDIPAATDDTLYLYNVAGSDAGMYDCQITDGTNTVFSALVTLDVSDMILSPGVVTPIYCYGDATGEVNVMVTGGISPYYYQWDDPLMQTMESAFSLTADYYSVTVTDEAGCTKNSGLNLTEPPALNVNVQSYNDISCYGASDGTITVQGTGGTPPYTYDLGFGSQGTGSFTGIDMGSYWITVTDGNNCTVESTDILISEPPQLFFNNVNPTDATCYGTCDGIINTLAIGGEGTLTYNIGTGPSPTGYFDDLCAGDYNVTVTDTSGCSIQSGLITLYQYDELILTCDSTNITCPGGNDGYIELFISGGTSPYDFSWTGPSGFTSSSNVEYSLDPGTYFITVTDAHSCATGVVITLDDGSPIIPNAVVEDISCFGVCDGSVSLTTTGGNGGYSYNWTGPSGYNSTDEDIFDLCSGTYNLTITDQYGCTANFPFILSEPPQINIISTGHMDVTCYGACNGDMSITASGGTPPLMYNFGSGWQSASYDSTVCAGTYTLSVRDSNLCTVSAGNLTIDQPPALNVTLNIVHAGCGQEDGSATAIVSGGTSPYHYLWSNGDTLVTADTLSAGTYSLQVTDDEGCIKLVYFTINNTSGPVITVNNVTNVSCYGLSNGAIQTTISGGMPPYVINWSNGDATDDITGLLAGTYEIEVTDDNGCLITQSITVTQPNPIQITISITNASCGSSNGSLTSSVTGGTPGYNYLWSSGGTGATENNLAAGSYSLTVTDSNGCTKVRSVCVSNDGAPVITLDSIVTASCNGQGAIYITVTGASGSETYLWSNGSTTEDLIGVPPGDYTITIYDGSCTAMLDFTIDAILPLEQPICVVTVDTATGTNLVVWEKVQTSGISHYNIYRETSVPDAYMFIDSVLYDSLSEYSDPVANPFTRSWKYKISAVDSCGNESDLSDPHKTIHLTMNAGLGNAFNLIWDDYEGFTYYTFYIHRHTDTNGWEILDSLPKTLHSFSNVPPTQNGLWYIVTVNTPGQCVSTGTDKVNGGPYSQSVSNLEDNGIIVNSQNLLKDISVVLYPNPNTGQLYINSNAVLGKMEVYDVTGQKIIYKNAVSPTDISVLVPGMYLVRIYDSGGRLISVSRIVKQ